MTIAAGIAILIALPRAEARAVLERGLASQPDRAALGRMWRRSLALGFAANVGYTARGVNAVAVPLRDPDGTPFGSLAVAAAAADLPATKLEETVASLAEEARRIERLARQILPEGAYNAGSPA